ncbi:MAG: sigma-70 family RNA polymerase sigma factor [Armatimonadota bacterium]|nr:sigma-70 family RNA polymerase sigma factor [Armatimonadota bacterium]MCX7777424.1 sigma-70 family RNA polymerase sigma factor [Armatimonadota bacterium]MDW8025093.1 sigma-70 family RNA polymerase sigma factor [Armatimonadota bacterium]
MAKRLSSDGSMPVRKHKMIVNHDDGAADKVISQPLVGEAYATHGSELQEERLIEACLRGEEWAWRELIALFHGRVYGMAYRVLGNHDDAMDVTQEVFIKVLEGLKRFRRGSTLSTWIYRISVNVCFDYLRRRREAPMSSLTEDERNEAFALPDPSPSPDEIAERGNLKELVRAAVSRLPVHLRIVIVLCDLEGLSYEEAASILHVPIGTIKSRLNRARLLLRNELSKLM